MSERPIAPANPTKAEASKAWRDFNVATSQVNRLNLYTGRPTAGMKADKDKWVRLLSYSTDLLNNYFRNTDTP